MGDGFQIVPIAFDHYRNTKKYPPIAASAEAAAIAELLRPFGGVAADWDEAAGRNLDATDDRLSQWVAGAYQQMSMLLWLGHGESNLERAWLVVPGLAGKRRDPEFQPHSLARYVIDHVRERGADPAWTIVVVEACGARRFAQLMEVELLREQVSRGVVLIASGQAQGRGYLAVFREALAEVLAGYDENDTEIRFGDLVGRLKDRLESGGGATVVIREIANVPNLVRASRLPEPIAAPVDVHLRLQRRLDAMPSHRPKVARRGVGAALGELAWNFVGRRQERDAIVDWLSGHDSGMLIVTGGEGSGKSALLGHILLHSRAEIGEIVALTDAPGHRWTPAHPLPRFDVSLLLGGATVAEVTAEIARAAAVTAPGAALSASERVSALVAGLRHRGRALTVLADALDESAEPVALAALFRQLAALPRVRLVVGTRPAAAGGWGEDDELLEALGAGGGPGATVPLRVERDEGTLTEFVRTTLEVLRAEHGDGFDAVIDRVASLITGRQREFLFASLAVQEILADPRLLRSGRFTELERLLGGDHQQLFAAALARICEKVTCGHQVLEALAVAHGRGMPRADRIWATAAGALGPETIGEDQLNQVIAAAAPYVMMDADTGQAVFRLAHRAFQEYFAGEQQHPGNRLKVASALVRLAEQQDGPLNPYLARYLSRHLASTTASPWTLLGDRPGLLDRLEPRAVTADATCGTDLHHLPAQILGVVTTAHLAEQAGPADRRGYRRLGIAQTAGAVGLAGEPADASAAAWDVVWAELRRHPLHLTLAGHTDRVRTAAVDHHAKPPVLATGGDDGLLLLWNPTTAESIPQAPALQDGRVLAATTVVTSQGVRLMAITCERGGRGSILLWNPVTGTTLRLTTGEWYVAAAVLTMPGGASLLAYGTRSGRIHLVDPTCGAPVGPALTGHAASVTGIAAYTGSAGEPRLVSTDADGSMRFWDPVAGRAVGSPVATGVGRLNAVVTLATADGTLVVAGGHDGTLLAGRPHGSGLVRWADVPGGVHALAPMPPDMVAAGSGDGTISLHTVSGPRPSPDHGGDRDVPLLTGHRGAIHTLTTFHAEDGTLRLASGADDHTVKLWNPAAALIRRPGTGGSADMALAALPGPQGAVLAGAGPDRPVSFRRLATGDPVRMPHVPPGPSAILAAVTLADGRPRLVSVPAGAADSPVSAWDPSSGDRATLFSTRHRFGGGPGASPTGLSALAAIPKGLLVTGWDDGNVRIYDAVRGHWSDAVNTTRHGAVRAVCGYRSRRRTVWVAAATADGGIRIWRPEGPGAPLLLPGSQEEWSAGLAAYEGPGREPLLVSVASEGTVRVWDPDAGRPVFAIRLGMRCRSLCQAEGLLVVGTDEGPLALRLTGVDGRRAGLRPEPLADAAGRDDDRQTAPTVIRQTVRDKATSGSPGVRSR